MMGTELTRNLQFLVQVVKADQMLGIARKTIGNKIERCYPTVYICDLSVSCSGGLISEFFKCNEVGKSSEIIKVAQNDFFCN